MRVALQIMVLVNVLIVGSASVAWGAGDEAFRRTFYQIVQTLSEPYYYGESPQDYELPLNRPPIPDSADGPVGEPLRGFAASAEQLAAEQQAADIIREEGLTSAMRHEAVRSNRRARRAAAGLARLQGQQRQWTRSNFGEDLVDEGVRNLERSQAQSEAEFRDFHGLPAAQGDGFLGEVLSEIALGAAQRFAAEAVADTEEQYSENLAASIDQSVQHQRRRLLDAMFKAGTQLQATSVRRFGRSPITWYVHYCPSTGAICLQAVNDGDHSLNEVMIRLHSKLAGTRKVNGRAAFTIAIPEWEPGKSVVLSSQPLTRLRLAKSRARNASDAEWVTKNVAPGQIVATVYTSNGLYSPQDLILPRRPIQAGRLEISREQSSAILRFQSQPLIRDREWITHAETQVIHARVVEQGRADLTLAATEGDATHVIPLRTLSAEDRKYLRVNEGQLPGMPGRLWTIRPETRLQATFAGLADSNTAVLQTASGDEKRVRLQDLAAGDRRYLALLTALR